MEGDLDIVLRSECWGRHLRLMRARRWQELMESGEYVSIPVLSVVEGTDLADAVGMDRCYLRRLMTLNTLAP